MEKKKSQTSPLYERIQDLPDRAENYKGLILLYIERKAEWHGGGSGEEGLLFQEQQS